MSPDTGQYRNSILPLASVALRQYEGALLRLQDLHAKSLDESEEANSVRDSMDGAWATMPPQERDIATGLSADLYMLSGNEIREKSDGAEDTAALDQRRSALYKAQRWMEFLRLLRRGSTDLSPDSIAILRYRSYENLGLQASAGRFLRRADELVPRDSRKVLAIIHAQQSGDIKAAVMLANAAIEIPQASPGLYVTAAGAILASTKGVDPELAALQWHRALDAATRALEISSIDEVEKLCALVYKGLAFEFLGNPTEARKAFAQAAEIDPFNPLVLDARAGQPADVDSQLPAMHFLESRLRLIERSTQYAIGHTAL